MALIPFKPAQLTAVVDKARSLDTVIKTRHFSRSSFVPSNTIQVDIKDGPQGLASFVDYSEASKRVNKEGWSTKTLSIPRITEHDIMHTADVLGYRNMGLSSVKLSVGEMLTALRNRIERTQEYICTQSLLGSCQDINGNVAVTYGLTAGGSIDFATQDILEFLEAGVEKVQDEVGSDTGAIHLYLGKTAYQNLRSSASFKDLRSDATKDILLEGGMLAGINGVMIHRLNHKYKNAAGTLVNYFPADGMLFVPENLETRAIYAPALVDNRMVRAAFAATSEDQSDPDGVKIRVESNMLPLIEQPAAIVKYTDAT